jgi:hypothetical protein
LTTDTKDSKKSYPITETITKTTESGAFIRTVIRRGKQRKQTTIRIKPNQKKVVLGHIGELEVYVYPFDFPDTVFLGKFPVSIQLSRAGVSEMMRMSNTCKWFLDGKAFNAPNWRKGVNARRRDIQAAYNQALLELRSSEKPRKTLNYNYTNNGEKK